MKGKKRGAIAYMYLNREVHIITCTWNMNNPDYNLIQNGLIPIE